MGLTLDWSRVAGNANVKKVRTRRINAERHRLLYNKVCHLLVPPTLVRTLPDGSQITCTPAISVKKRKSK